MAITLEQAEKLREKADVTLEEAKAALEAADGDLLDALIWLERQGKPSPGPAAPTPLGTDSGAPPRRRPAGHGRRRIPGRALGTRCGSCFKRAWTTRCRWSGTARS